MLYYCKTPKGNFGDDLNLWLWPRLAPEVCDEQDSTLFVGIGTILSHHIPAKPVKMVFGAGRLAYALLSSRCGPASLKNKNEKIFPRREISTAHGVQMLFGGGPSDREKRHSVSFAW